MKNKFSDIPRLHNEPNRLRLYFLFNYLEVMFLCVVVTKGAQFDQFDWPKKIRCQVSISNIGYKRTVRLFFLFLVTDNLTYNLHKLRKLGLFFYQLRGINISRIFDLLLGLKRERNKQGPQLVRTEYTYTTSSRPRTSIELLTLQDLLLVF